MDNHKLYQIEIDPSGPLFFRDARPMGASDIGSGAAWPQTGMFHNAMLSAFHEKWPALQDWEFPHHRRVARDVNWNSSSMRFGGLKTAGPFPFLEGRMYFPTPSDLVAEENKDGSVSYGVMSPASCPGKSNLPASLKQSPLSPFPPSKAESGPWLSTEDFGKYLNGRLEDLHPRAASDFYVVEARPGVAIDPNTGTALDKGLYQAEYLRLKPGVSMTAFAECASIAHPRGDGPSNCDVMELFFEDANKNVAFGGQRGMVYLKDRRAADLKDPFAFIAAQPTGVRIKWVLLSPSVFVGGWLPGWLNPVSGKVMLKRGGIDRIPGEKREAWRARLQQAPAIDATLVAARVPKPVAFSGWQLDTCVDAEAREAQGQIPEGGRTPHARKPGPKATILAVPAGAVYYFEAVSPEAAASLVAALNGQRCSDRFGERGFGVGVCAAWQAGEAFGSK